MSAELQQPHSDRIELASQAPSGDNFSARVWTEMQETARSGQPARSTENAGAPLRLADATPANTELRFDANIYPTPRSQDRTAAMPPSNDGSTPMAAPAETRSLAIAAGGPGAAQSEPVRDAAPAPTVPAAPESAPPEVAPRTAASPTEAQPAAAAAPAERAPAQRQAPEEEEGGARDPYAGFRRRNGGQMVEARENRDMMHFGHNQIEAAAENGWAIDLSSRAMEGLSRMIPRNQLGPAMAGLVSTMGAERATQLLETIGRNGRMLGGIGIGAAILSAGIKADRGDSEGAMRELRNVAITMGMATLGTAAGGPMGGAVAAFITDRYLNSTPMERREWDRSLQAPAAWARHMDNFYPPDGEVAQAVAESRAQMAAEREAARARVAGR